MDNTAKQFIEAGGNLAVAVAEWSGQEAQRQKLGLEPRSLADELVHRELMRQCEDY